MSKEEMPTTFPKKWLKVLAEMPEFKDSADAASPEELKKIIVQCEGNIYNVQKEKSEDTKLNAAKDLVREYGSAYRDAVKMQNCKIQYSLWLLEGKGVELGTSEG